jgi:hypothetical protein
VLAGQRLQKRISIWGLKNLVRNKSIFRERHREDHKLFHERRHCSFLNSALAGNSKSRPELIDAPLPLVSRISVLRRRGRAPIAEQN